MNKTKARFGRALGVLLLCLGGQPAQAAELALADAVRQALAANPGIAAQQARAEALRQVPAQAGALPEPRLRLNATSLPLDSFSLGQTPMTQLQLGLSQALPFPGKLALREESAQWEARASLSQVDESEIRLAGAVKRQWWQLFYLDRAIESVLRNQNLLRQFVDVAQTKYSVGQGLQQDVLLAQVELSRFEDQELSLRAMRRKAEARLNALMGRAAETPVSLVAEVSRELPELRPSAEYLALAEQHRPELQALKYQIEAARARVALADKDYYPDFNLGVVYGQRQGYVDLATIQLSMNLPINTANRQDRARDQRKQEWLQKKYSLDDLRNRIAEQIDVAMADYRRARKQTELYDKSIIPQASQTVESMLAGYQVNKVDFLNLVRAQVTLFNYETQYWQALSAANQALAALEVAVGKEMYR